MKTEFNSGDHDMPPSQAELGAVIVASHSPQWQVLDVILPAPEAIHVRKADSAVESMKTKLSKDL